METGNPRLKELPGLISPEAFLLGLATFALCFSHVIPPAFLSYKDTSLTGLGLHTCDII